MVEAAFAECLIVAESPEPVRFSEIYQWNNGQFAGPFTLTLAASWAPVRWLCGNSTSAVTKDKRT